MSMIHRLVKRPVGVTMAVLTLIILGAVAVQGLGLDLLPDLELPQISVLTIYPGADPGTVETDVTNPLEDLIATVPGLVRLRSTSSENLSLITAEFTWGSDLDAAQKTLENRISIATRLLPSGVEPPIILQADLSLFPVLMVAVSGDGDPVEITRRMETYVKPRLQQVAGVASVEVLGGTYEEVSVRYDSAQLQEYGITPTLLYQVIAAQNIAVPAGAVIEDGIRYNLKAGQVITDLEALRNQPVALRQGAPTPGLPLLAIGQAMPVRLRDVADVEIAPKQREGATRVNGEPAVILRVLKQSGENSVQISQRVREALSQLESSEELGLRFHYLIDQADLVNASLSQLSSSAVVGGTLAVAVLFLFLRSLPSIAVIALAVPLSITGAFVIMYAMGTGLNMMSMGGLALAIGMLVDNAIVVLENIFRLRQEGKSSREAAMVGGSQIASAIAASTVTTLVVFAPVFFLKSWAGFLFRDTGIAVSASLIASLAVALGVVPVAASVWLRSSRRLNDVDGETRSTFLTSSPLPDMAETLPSAQLEAATAREVPKPAGSTKITSQETELTAAGGIARGRMQQVYRSMLAAWTARAWLTPLALGLCLAALIFIPGRLESQFLPPTDGGLIHVRLTAPAGWSAAETEQHVAAIEEAVLRMPEVVTVATLVGDQGAEELLAQISNLGPHEAQMTVVLVPKNQRQRSAAQIADEITALERDPRIALRVDADRTSAALGDDFFPGLTVELTGPDLATLRHLAEDLAERLQSTNGFHAVSSSVGASIPELFFRVTERSMQSILAGGEPLTAGQVGLALRNHLIGVSPTTVTLDGRRLPVVIRPQAEETRTLDAVRDFRIPGAQLTSSGGQPILDRIASLAQVEGEAAIRHRDRVRMATVRAELDGIGLEEARLKAQQILAGLDLPPGYRAEITGIHQAIDDAIKELSWALLAAVALIYAVMAIQFESISQPLVIMVTVPLALSGALVALGLSRQALGVPSLIGFLLLVGVAVNNAIVMIDAVNRLRSTGKPPLQAILDGAVERLRPILMTSITSIFGLIPLVLAVGEGSELLVPMAVAVMGGLISSTFLSLFVIPGLLALGHRLREKRRNSPSYAVLVLALAMSIASAVEPAQAADARSAGPIRWRAGALMGAAWLSGEPHPVAGINVSRIHPLGHDNFQVSGGVREGSPQVVSAAVGRFFPSAANAQLVFRSDWWLAAGRQSSLSLMWDEPNGPRRLSLTKAVGERPLHPWSGEPGAPEGWHLEHAQQLNLSHSLAVENRVWLHAREGAPPRWLVTSGRRWRQVGFFEAHVEGGLLLQAGAYQPLLRIGATVTLLPQGSVDVAFSPPLPSLPRGWPLLRIAYRTPGLSPPLALQLQWLRGDDHLQPQASLRITPTGSRYTINLSWSPHSPTQALVTVERWF